MTAGPVLDLVAWAAAAAAVAGAWSSVRDAGHRPSPRTLALLSFATAAPVALFLFLASRFLAADLSYQHVFFYTATDVEWPWRLAGSWAGREGSMLLWTSWLAVATLGVAWWHKRAPPTDAAEIRGRAWTVAVLATALALFLIAVATQSAFLPTEARLLDGRPEGNGLNPTLKSGYILIHPPMMFAAYAAATIPLAAALAHLATGTDRWSRVAMPWTRLGWLLMTFSLGLGALWAYYTLGFGGYWAWDPVEVANLLPWLAFTVYLHAQLHHERHGSYRNMGPFLAVLPFLLTLFSTISTRSGLWVSVHAFTDPTDTFNPDAAARFLDILRVEPSLAFHVGLFLATLAAFLAAWCLRLAKDHGRLAGYSRAVALLLGLVVAYALLAPASAVSALVEAGAAATGGSAGLGLLGLLVLACIAAALPMLWGSREAPAAKPRGAMRQGVNLRSLAAYSILALGLALLVLFIFHVAAAQRGSTARFYEERFPYLALPVILGILVFQGHQAYGRRKSLWLAAGALAAAVAAWLLARSQGDFRLAQGALLFVPALALTWVGFARIRKAGPPSGTPRAVRRADALLLLAALLDVLFWLNPPTVRLGPWSWQPVWPMQALLGGLSLVALWGAARSLAGHPLRWQGAVHVLAGALGGFYVAPVLAAISWLLRRGHLADRRDHDPRWRARLHQVALHGIHFAIALALLGYAPSTYLKESRDVELAAGAATDVAGFAVTFDGTRTEGSTGPVDHAAVQLRATGHGITGALEPPLAWERRAGAHFPLPATLRTWTGDLYADVTAVHVAAGSFCLGPEHTDGAWVEAYRAGSPSRLCAEDTIDAVRFKVAWLPGLGILWLALAVGVGAMAVLMGTAARPTPGPASSSYPGAAKP
jgi:cytochrome c biogenesis factor